jgi:deoxyribodipyrimidine photo-lyase
LNFNILGQSTKFDAKGDFIKRWVPELGSVPVDYIHDPWNMPSDIQAKIGVIIGKDYPQPI